jgi:HEPN domain-containing protein
MTKPRVPRDLLDPVVDYFKPQRVILFGSRARGEATRDSDIDLLVIVDDDTPLEKLTLTAGHDAYRSSYRRAADVFPMRAETFERERAIANTLAAEADADGIVVYGTPRGSCMKAPDPRARWQAVERWLRVAERDRKMALACMTSDPPLHDGAAFHCQQAVEKLLKGFLTLAGKRGGKTHSLEQLGALAQQSFPDIAGLVAAAHDWSKWATVYRYPEEDAPPEPDEAELRAALAVIDALAVRLRAANPEPPGS